MKIKEQDKYKNCQGNKWKLDQNKKQKTVSDIKLYGVTFF